MEIKLTKMNLGEFSHRSFYQHGCECCAYYGDESILNIDNGKEQELEQIHHTILNYIDYKDLYFSYDRCSFIEEKINQRKTGKDLVLGRYDAKKFICDQHWKEPNVPIVFIPSKNGLEEILNNLPEGADAFCIKENKPNGLCKVEFYNVKGLTRWGMAV